MSREKFKKSLEQNKREKGGSTSVRVIDIFFPESQKADWKWTMFAKDILGTATGDKYPWTRVGREESKGYLFTWNAGFDSKMDDAKIQKLSAQMQKATRDFMKGRRTKGEEAKDIARSDLPKGTKDKDAKKHHKYEGYVGGHVASQAYVMMLRKAVAAGYPAQKAAELARGLSHGFTTKDRPEGDQYGKGMITTYDGHWGEDDTLLKKISAEEGVEYELDREVMVPIPGTTNARQRTEYEMGAQKWLQDHLENWVGSEEGQSHVRDETSLPLISQLAEVIAARLLGRKDKRYKDNHRVTKKPKLTARKRPLPIVKRKRLRDRKQNQQQALANPVSLRNLINRKLGRTVTDNMGHPSLENVSGRFASSVRLVNITQHPTTPVFQYTYQKRPYQVFEGTEPWAAGGDRDPQRLIDKSIREIAAELMLGRFTTQRL